MILGRLEIFTFLVVLTPRSGGAERVCRRCLTDDKPVRGPTGDNPALCMNAPIEDST